MSEARSAEQGLFHGGSRPIGLFAIAGRVPGALQSAYAEEVELRRPFLWRVAAAGAGALLYFAANREPSLGLCVTVLLVAGLLLFLTRRNVRAHALCILLACVVAGFTAGAWRAARVAAPIVPRVGIGELTGFVEEVDLRRAGARFILRVASAEGFPDDVVPARVRLTTRGDPNFAAGDFVALKARLLPPARAALPGGYDFARDAYFASLGGVGSALGRIETMPPPDPAPLSLRFFAAVDRMRNTLALRVFRLIGGDTGAIAAAMVTGKRDFLSESAKDLIRRAGIFHIVTISGIQMTLVAGIFFVGLRRLMATAPNIALNHPVKKWAAALAMIGAVFYDIGAGSRIGTDRALIMTLIMLGAVLFDRPSLSMRNLALAVLVIIAFEPEALLGASFQLSFAAVAALIAVYETRSDMVARNRMTGPVAPAAGRFRELKEEALDRLLHGPGAALVATLCATSATAAFMAHDFQELSPYVLIGNPLTLAIIEFFAVPCALIGAALYPLGLDGFIWRWLEMGINLICWIAGLIASAPGASLHVKSFAPWAIVFFTLAVVSAVLWRTWTLRATALPLVAIGLLGAVSGARFDVAIAPTGDAAAVRLSNGDLGIVGKRPGAFAAEQWLRADADARLVEDARGAGDCDDFGCVAAAIDGRLIALVNAPAAFLEDCARAAIVITPLHAPQGCDAPLVIDRTTLDRAGAITLRLSKDGGVEWTTARAIDEDRPWSPKFREPLNRSSRDQDDADVDTGPLD